MRVVIRIKPSAVALDTVVDVKRVKCSMCDEEHDMQYLPLTLLPLHNLKIMLTIFDYQLRIDNLQ